MSDLNKRILLLVEDDSIIALSQKSTLEKYGYEVITANSGEKAIILSRENQNIELILMDIDLGEGIDGTETARRILNVCTIPIVFLSSHTEPQIVEKTEQITSYGYVVKNSGITVLDASIKMAFKLFEAHILAEKEISERKKTEERLTRINEIFNLSQESSGLGTWDWDVQNGIIEWTENLFKIYGIDSQKHNASFETWRSILHPDDLAEAEANIEKALKEHLDLFNEYRIITSDGEERWIYALGKGIYDEHGQPQRMIGVCIDITGRKRAEESLKYSESKYRNLFEAESDAIFLVDEETGQIFEANAAAIKTYGYSFEELLTKSSRDISAEPDLTGKAIENRERFIPIRWHRKKDGTVFPVEINVNHVTFNNRSVHIIAIRDITERIQMENVLLKSEALFRGLIENVPIGMFQSTHEGKFIYVNPALSDMLGYSTSEELMQTVNRTSIADELYENPELRPQLVQQVKQSINTLKVFENRYRCRDGQVIDAILSFCEVEDPITGVKFLNGFVQDITARKKLEEVKAMDEARLEALLSMSRMENSTVKEIADFTLEQIVILTGSRIGFLGFIDDMETVMTVHAWSQDVMRECAISDKPLLFDLETSGIWAEAVKEHRVVIVNDYSADLKGKKGIPAGHVSLSRLISIPVFESGRVVAVASVANKITDYEESDIRQVRLLTDGMIKAVRRLEFDKIIKESQTKYKVVADNTYDWEFWLSPEGKYLYISPSCKQITGYNAEAFIEDSGLFLNIVHREDRNQLIEHQHMVNTDLVTSAIQFRIITSDGIIKWIDHICQPVFDGEGNYLGTRGSNRDFTDRKQAEDSIQNLLREKELILHEVHHRIKNNMNTILGLLTLQADAQENPDIKSVLIDAAGRMQGMRVLYDKLYCSGNDQSLSIREYLPVLIDQIINIFPQKNSVRIITQIEDIILNAKYLNPIGIIINELITNSMKYAFYECKNGIITLTAAMKENEVIIVYEDNGIGLPESITIENSTGFGMKLVGMLIDQIGGSIKIERGKYARFIMKFEI